MFIQLKSHKAHIYTKNSIDPSKRTIVFIPGAGMDHRILSMFKLDSINNNGVLEFRRLERYRKRVYDIIRNRLEDSFWSSDKIDQLHQFTKKVDRTTTSPHVMAKNLL